MVDKENIDCNVPSSQGTPKRRKLTPSEVNSFKASMEMFELEITERSDEMNMMAEIVSSKIKNGFRRQLSKLPRKIRSMNLATFVHQYSGKAEAVLQEQHCAAKKELDSWVAATPRIAQSISKSRPTTSMTSNVSVTVAKNDTSNNKGSLRLLRGTDSSSSSSSSNSSSSEATSPETTQKEAATPLRTGRKTRTLKAASTRRSTRKRGATAYTTPSNNKTKAALPVSTARRITRSMKKRQAELGFTSKESSGVVNGMLKDVESRIDNLLDQLK